MPDTKGRPRNRDLVELLDYDGAASVLKTTPRHVRKLVELREIASVKVGSLVRLHPDDVAAYIERRRRPTVGV